MLARAASMADPGLDARQPGQSRHAVRTTALALIRKVIVQLAIPVNLASARFSRRFSAA